MAGRITLEKNNSSDFYFVGIKGSGMASLALLFSKLGAKVYGSDVPEVFYTDAMLRSAGIAWKEHFHKDNIPASTDIVVYSDAWNTTLHPEIREAARRKLACYSYSEMLGALSKSTFSVAVAGVHGKTSTAAILAYLCDALKAPVAALVGGALKDFQDHSMLFRGTSCLIAESCEYRRNFLHFHPDILLVTSIEQDHTDYYAHYEDIFKAFLEYALRLPEQGSLVYCADDEGSAQLAKEVSRRRGDLRLIPYGTQASGPYRVSSIREEPGVVSMELPQHGPWQLPHPSLHTLVNSAGALAAVSAICRVLRVDPDWEHAKEALARFQGVKRRSEVVGRCRGITVVDDYAHHPTAIRKTLQGFRTFFACRRLVVAFMPHTYSRTQSLLAGFARCFAHADEVIINDIYASAREVRGDIDGKVLAEAVAAQHPKASYESSFESIASRMAEELREGDLFVTMGAGNNWEIGLLLKKKLEQTT